MKDARVFKRRRVSKDVDGDIEMGNDNQDVFSVPSSPNNRASPTPVKSASRRRSSRGEDKPDTETTGQDGEDEKDETQTPARVGTRSSGRQRKTPKRYEEEVVTPSSRRKSAATPSRTARASRSAQKPRQSPVEDEEPESEEDDEEEEEEDDDDEMDLDESSPEPARRKVTRTNSKRTAVRAPRTSRTAPRTTARTTTRTRSRKVVVVEPKEKSASPEYQDGLDELVTMQLPEDLYQQPEAPETTDVSEPLPEYVESFQALCKTGLEDEVRILSTILLEKLSGRRQIPVRGLEPEYQKVHQLIEQTVSIGEGNSMLLLGSRGCGKTAIVESIISSLKKEHSNDFHVVRLNGFLHTDDRLALREMWRQLGREMHTEDDAAKVSSYADTMATLLALLSHPEELFGASGDPGSKTAAKSIVILLDEFDLFVTHPRQTLLYNLFDIAQARKAPIAVIGLTTKVDVTEMLEKRVKSRFSHRYTYVPLPRSFETFSDICLGSLDLRDAEMADVVNELGSDRTLVESDKWRTLLEGWKEYLKVRSMIFSFIQLIGDLLNLLKIAYVE
jgi:origin recognition complex subunit 4